jgi:hypothetical protein
MFSEPEIIYRVVGTLTPKSVSLHKDGDYQTGLSFLEWNPGGQTIRFRISRLSANNYAVKRDGGQPMVNIWNGEPYIEPNSGLQLIYPSGHVSVWHRDHDYWHRWHLADKTNVGTPNISTQLQIFFELREVTL